MDTYSNILYVKEATAKLSFLAHSAVEPSRYRPPRHPRYFKPSLLEVNDIL
jgi:hypothetical protein